MEVTGEWRTTASRYADRTLEISRESLRFSVPGVESSFYPIDKVRRDDREDAVLFTVLYRDEGGRNELAFYFVPGQGGTIQFKNQRSVLWKRVAQGGAGSG